MNQTPADPSAYRVHYQRTPDDAHGILTSISIVERGTEAGDDDLLVSYYGDDDLDRLISLAREVEGADPYSSHLPSDRALVVAALRELAIPVIDDDPDASWRAVLLTVRVASSSYRTEAADFIEDNDLSPDERRQVIALARGERDEMRMGGDAAPLAVIRRAPQPVPRLPADAMDTHGPRFAVGGTLDGGYSVVSLENSANRLTAERHARLANAAPALLAAAKGILAVWPYMECNETRALRAAIAQAEGRA